MTQLNNYQALNLQEGASISEIKAAFRNMAKTHHPDAQGQSQEDVEKFIKASSAYQSLLKKAVAHNRHRRANAKKDAAQKTESRQEAKNWRFISQREVGLDVYYSLYILRPQGNETEIIMPWQVQEACPRCLGQGRTLSRLGQNSLYRPQTCDKCSGTGSVSRASQVKIKLTDEQIGQNKIRLRSAGLYKAQTATRGDLILDITWVTELPRQN